MPLFFGSIGILLIIAGLRDRIINGDPSLVSLLESDFTLSSPGSFTMWAFAIIFIGALGYIPKMRGISRAFLALVVVVIFVKNKQLQNVLTNVATFFGSKQRQDAFVSSPLQTQEQPITGTIQSQPLQLLNNLPALPVE